MPTELEVTKWIEEIDVVAARIGPRFSRKDLRAHSAHYLRGLMRLSCGPGQKGERLYDWVDVSWPNCQDKKFTRGFLVRRSLSDPEAIAYFFTNAPQRTTLKTIVRIAGRLRNVPPRVDK